MSKNLLNSAAFHFVGIGGIGMCGLAELLFNMGAKVTGSDLHENANTLHLKKVGIPVFIGHSAKNIQDPDVIVFTSAAKNDNPELLEARRRKIPLIPRAEALAEIMRLHRGIAVAGTHGKTTTTSMTAAIFLEAGAQPTIVVGGRLDLIQSTALLGQGEWLIAEADESDGSFNRLSPEIAVITNIDKDHLDHFKSFENLQSAFLQFAARVPFYGAIIVCGDDLIIKKIFADFPKPVLSYGFAKENDFVIEGQNGNYRLSLHGKELGSFEVHVPGRHNALNATAAIVAAVQAGFDFAVAAKGLLKFKGVDRRFQLRGQFNGAFIYEDYGHHPTEILATLQGFREKYPKQPLKVLFQPHRYSRTQLCWGEFLDCFGMADQIWITDIYAAGEKPIPGIDSKKLAGEIRQANCSYLAKDGVLQRTIAGQLNPGDVFVALGAGDVWKVGIAILSKVT